MCRRKSIYTACVVAGSLVMAGCDQELVKNPWATTVPKLAVVFFDISGTTVEADWRLYEQQYAALTSEDGDLRPGDRVVVASISATTFTDFVPIADVTFPNTGITLNDADGAAVARLKLKGALHKLRKQFKIAPDAPGRARSTIIEATNVADQVFRNDVDRASRHLVLFSDGLEDSDNAKFIVNTPTADTTKTLIDKLKGKDRLASLAGVRVHMVGARAPSGVAMLAIEKFWRAFFVAAGAEIRPGDYARAGTILRLGNE